MTTEIDGSFGVTVETTAWGDITLTLAAHDLRIQLDPADAARVCQEVWQALGQARTPGLGLPARDVLPSGSTRPGVRTST